LDAPAGAVGTGSDWAAVSDGMRMTAKMLRHMICLL
jgi:hypothetical protein